uniref:Uncharacterized protein n=1 Tax=Medicago truncatula TaxID=3880 RepID=I3SMT8_MEDTR|nr:unknown [Medicago truncatula]
MTLYGLSNVLGYVLYNKMYICTNKQKKLHTCIVNGKMSVPFHVQQFNTLSKLFWERTLILIYL